MSGGNRKAWPGRNQGQIRYDPVRKRESLVIVETNPARIRFYGPGPDGGLKPNDSPVGTLHFARYKSELDMMEDPDGAAFPSEVNPAILDGRRLRPVYTTWSHEEEVNEVNYFRWGMVTLDSLKNVRVYPGPLGTLISHDEYLLNVNDFNPPQTKIGAFYSLDNRVGEGATDIYPRGFALLKKWSKRGNHEEWQVGQCLGPDPNNPNGLKKHLGWFPTTIRTKGAGLGADPQDAIWVETFHGNLDATPEKDFVEPRETWSEDPSKVTVFRSSTHPENTMEVLSQSHLILSLPSSDSENTEAQNACSEEQSDMVKPRHLQCTRVKTTEVLISVDTTNFSDWNPNVKRKEVASNTGHVSTHGISSAEAETAGNSEWDIVGSCKKPAVNSDDEPGGDVDSNASHVDTNGTSSDKAETVGSSERDIKKKTGNIKKTGTVNVVASWVIDKDTLNHSSLSAWSSFAKSNATSLPRLKNNNNTITSQGANHGSLSGRAETVHSSELDIAGGCKESTMKTDVAPVTATDTWKQRTVNDWCYNGEASGKKSTGVEMQNAESVVDLAGEKVVDIAGKMKDLLIADTQSANDNSNASCQSGGSSRLLNVLRVKALKSLHSDAAARDSVTDSFGPSDPYTITTGPGPVSGDSVSPAKGYYNPVPAGRVRKASTTTKSASASAITQGSRAVAERYYNPPCPLLAGPVHNALIAKGPGDKGFW